MWETRSDKRFRPACFSTWQSGPVSSRQRQQTRGSPRADRFHGPRGVVSLGLEVELEIVDRDPRASRGASEVLAAARPDHPTATPQGQARAARVDHRDHHRGLQPRRGGPPGLEGNPGRAVPLHGRAGHGADVLWHPSVLGLGQQEISPARATPSLSRTCSGWPGGSRSSRHPRPRRRPLAGAAWRSSTPSPCTSLTSWPSGVESPSEKAPTPGWPPAAQVFEGLRRPGVPYQLSGWDQFEQFHGTLICQDDPHHP